MIAEVVQPIIKEMSLPEQRKLLYWLQSKLNKEALNSNLPLPETNNIKLRNKLIKHIQKRKK